MSSVLPLIEPDQQRTFSVELTSNNIILTLTLFAIGTTYAPVFKHMISIWMLDENNSHGVFVPLISCYLIFKHRQKLFFQSVDPSNWGLVIIILGIFMLLFGWLATEYFTQEFSFLVVFAGCIVYLYGWGILRVLSGPLAYLILMIPIPAIIYDAAAFPLKLFVTKVSVDAMKALGILVVREGNVMAFPNITLEVVNACSGLRSLTSLLAIGLAYVMLFVRLPWQKYVIIALIFPIALLANMVRVIGTGVLAQYFGAAAAEGFFHEFAGLVIFITSLALLICAHRVLTRWSR